MSGYHPNRPMNTSDDQINVQISVGLNQLLSLDGLGQVLHTTARLTMLWNNPDLMWSPDDYNGLAITTMSARDVWVPIIGLRNSAAFMIGKSELYLIMKMCKISKRKNYRKTIGMNIILNVSVLTKGVIKYCITPYENVKNL